MAAVCRRLSQFQPDLTSRANPASRTLADSSPVDESPIVLAGALTDPPMDDFPASRGNADFALNQPIRDVAKANWSARSFSLYQIVEAASGNRSCTAVEILPESSGSLNAGNH
jgi:hypothetical protein